MSKYRRIKYEDRCQIYALSKRGSSQESIAEVLGVSQSAVSRRFTAIVVSAAIGSSKRKPRLKHGRRYEVSPVSLTVPTRRKIEAKLRQMRWSPEQISGWLSEQGIKLSHERIYQMIWYDKRDGGDLWRSLRRRGKRYNRRAGKTPDAPRSPIELHFRASRDCRAQNPSGRRGGRYRCQRRTQRRLAHAGRAQNPISQNHQVAARPPAQHKRLRCVASSLSATSCTPSPSTTERSSRRIRTSPMP